MCSCDDERGPQLYKIDSAGQFFPYKVHAPPKKSPLHMEPSLDRRPLPALSHRCARAIVPLYQGTAAGAKAHEATNWLEKRIAPVPDTDDDDTIQLAIMCLQHVRRDSKTPSHAPLRGVFVHASWG